MSAMPFVVESAPRFDRDLRAAPDQVIKRSISALDELALDPLTPRPGFDVKPLTGIPGMYRLRIGTWRLLYRVDLQGRRVYVTTISKRATAYRGA